MYTYTGRAKHGGRSKHSGRRVVRGVENQGCGPRGKYFRDFVFKKISEQKKHWTYPLPGSCKLKREVRGAI